MWRGEEQPLQDEGTGEDGQLTRRLREERKSDQKRSKVWEYKVTNEEGTHKHC